LKTLGVMAPYLMGIYPGALVAALYRNVRMAGASMLLMRTGTQMAHYELDLGIERADAWVVVLNPASPDWLRRILATGRPVSVIAHDYGMAELGLVRVDNRAGILAAMQRLYERGHRRFAYIGPAYIADCVERRDTVLEFTQTHADCAPALIQDTLDFSYAAGRDAARKLLDQGVLFSALIAATDNNAMGAITLLRESGLRVPEDVAVVGFDNSIVSHTIGNGITSLDQNLDALADMAFADVYRRSQDPTQAPVNSRVKPVLVERGSTACIETVRSPQLIEREVAQYFIAVSEEVGQIAAGGRDAYLREYLKRLEFRLRFASVARLVDAGSALQVVLASPEGGDHGRASVGKRLALAMFPVYPASSVESRAGDFIAVLLQEGLVQGTEVIALCFRGEDLNSPLALESLTHEIELLCYQLHVQMMSDELQRTLSSLRATQDELLRIEKHAALGVAIAGIAHELNTPLGNCLLASSTLSDSAVAIRQLFNAGQLKKTDIEHLLSNVELTGQVLGRNIGSALRLVEDFKQIGGEHVSGRTEHISLSLFMQDMLTVLRVRCWKTGVEIHCTVDGAPELDTYPQLLSQVLSELVENALIHGFSDGVGGTIQITAGVANAKLILAISDNGRGIAPGDLERVFDPFYTTRMGAASGLGLTMVHNLVSGPLLGKVWAELGEGKGVRFVIELPVSDATYLLK